MGGGFQKPGGKSFSIGGIITVAAVVGAIAILVIPNLLKTKNETVVEKQMNVIRDVMKTIDQYPVDYALRHPESNAEKKINKAMTAIEERGYTVKYTLAPSRRDFTYDVRPNRVGVDGQIAYHLDKSGEVVQVHLGGGGK